MIQTDACRIILSSGSAARAALLGAAGIRFDVMPSELDEAALKAFAVAECWTVARTAATLAGRKAEIVSSDHPDALVIGADQMLICEGQRYDKPGDMRQAVSHLQSLRGRTHDLVTAVVCVRRGVQLWSHVASPRLTMRWMSDAWIDAYLSREGEAVLASVGAYRLEGFGLQCFASIEGEYGAIIGLPMLPLLGFLREHGILGV